MAWADWRDDYAYAADGTPARLDPHPRRRSPRPSPPTASGSSPAPPTARPLAVEAVAYPLRRDDEGRLTVEEIAAALP